MYDAAWSIWSDAVDLGVLHGYRNAQASVLALFIAGPWFGVWIVKGNLSSSLTLGVLPLTDPYVLAQSLAAGHWGSSSRVRWPLSYNFSPSK